MTRDKGREPHADQDEEDEAAEGASDREAIAEAATRILRDDDDAEHAGSQIADSEAATVLADEDDRTVMVSREQGPSVRSPAAGVAKTHVIVSDAMPKPATASTSPAPSAAIEAESTPAETRVLETAEDKTSPPAVNAGPPARAATASAAPDPSRGLEPGMVLFGEYEIVNVLGVGGMGEVYRARHRRLDEHRAIKVMHAELSKKKGASEFFYREAKALLAVRHPAVVHCHDLLSDDEGRVYLIMEMIEGIPLSAKMNDGPLSPDDVAVLGARVAHGLSAAHRKGVIHRDVSPDNIVLPNGRVQEAKLIDFGIAKILQEGEGTIVDGFKGKLSYASPEQLGFFGGKMDGSSDFYSLGLVLVAAALGRPMSMGTTVMEAVDARRGFQALPDEIPVGVRSAIQPLLALDPKDRPKYVDRLFVVPGGAEGATDPGGYARLGASSPGATTQESSRGRLGLLIGAGTAAIAAVAAAGFFLASERVSPPSPSVAIEGAVPAIGDTTGAPAPAPAPVVAPTASAETVEVEAREKAAEPVPAKPATRRMTASDRIRVIGLLNNAKLALGENRLMSPANDNAYDRYRSVLELDPSNRAAQDGLREVAGRYLQLSSGAVAQGDRDQAQIFLDRARKADPTHPGISGTEALVGN